MVEFKTATLGNGLTLIGEIRKSAMSVACGFFVRTGSRDETPVISGVSHFLEHMMFKGTAKRSALDISYELGAMGAQSNAYTSSEITVYYGAVLPEFFERKLELLCDMLRPALDQKEFDTEKKVILEEISLYHDKPSHVLLEASLSNYFGDHGAGNSVLGSLESVGALTRDAMLDYFQRRYSPSNMVLAASGNFDWDRFVDLADNYCSSWRNFGCGRELKSYRSPGGSYTIKKSNLQKGYACLLGTGVGAQDSCLPSAEVLSCIIGDFTGSRAYWELIDKGLADSASVDVDSMDGVGVILGYVSSDPERIDEVTDTLQALLLDPLSFSDEDLQRARTKIRTRLVLQGESSLKRLHSIGVDWVYLGSYESLEDKLEKYSKVTRATVEDYISRVPFGPLCRNTLIPENSK